MIKITQIKLPVSHAKQDLKNKIIKELRLKHIFASDMPVFTYDIIRRSIDARKKPDIFYVYSVSVDFKNDKTEAFILKKCKNSNASLYDNNEYILPDNPKKLPNKRPVVVGFGPGGMFAAYILALKGLKPVVIERGDKVSDRIKKVSEFWNSGRLDTESNVQFGEGGAGTFSDGKLNTLVKDPSGRNKFVLNTFVKFGAKENIAYDAKPHVGTDILEKVVSNMREEIERLGGTVLNRCRFEEFNIDNGNINKIKIINNSGFEYKVDDLVISSGENYLETNDVILAVGHSARDTFKMLYNSKVNMEQKSFAVGLRVVHPQTVINESQYGKGYDNSLPAADYKVTNKSSNGKNVYSFCMCPGGYVVNSSSYDGQLVVNGMSYSERDSKTANSAIIVNVDSSDFGSEDVFAGMEFQIALEKKAYELGKGYIPAQTFKGFKENKTVDFDETYAVTKGKINKANLRELFNDNINEAFIESMEKFGYTIMGFSDDNTLLFGVESRTSSPVRIVRDEYFESNIKGIYPCGEGAGYAGGITSAAMDGIKVAEAIIKKYDR